MNKKTYLIISIISFIFSGISLGITMLFALVGNFMCGKPFYMISGSDGPIPSCTPIFNTDFKWIILFGGILLIVGIISIIVYKKGSKR